MAATEAGDELARRAAAVGNLSKLRQAREQGFYAEAALALARTEAQALSQREALIRALRLWAEQTTGLTLPELPAAAREKPEVEHQAIAQRLDVQAAQRDAEQRAAELRLDRRSQRVNALELGLLRNSSNEAPIQRGLELTLELPLVRPGSARLARAESLYLQALEHTAQVAIEARSQAREACLRYRSAHDITQHYQREIVPICQRIADETLLRHNGMLIGVFELMADARVLPAQQLRELKVGDKLRFQAAMVKGRTQLTAIQRRGLGDVTKCTPPAETKAPAPTPAQIAGMLPPVLKTIPTHQLRLGMFLHQLTGSWMSHPFWRSRFMLRDARDITKLLEAGIQEVVIDTDQGLDVAPDPVGDAPSPVSATAAAPAVVEEPTPALPPAHPAVASAGPQYTEALDVSRRSLGAVVELFQQARMGQALDSQTCLPVVEDVMSSVSASPSALISIARLKTVDDYTYMHAVAVCALMVGLARQMGLPDALVREAGLAGLLLDTGKAAMPPELLGKSARVNDEEMALLKTHVRKGHEMLLKEGGFSAAVLDACLHHHERVDGSGYPDGLVGDKIAPLARMAAICDVYDAVTSRRPYRAPWDPGEAMRHMAQAKGQFDPQIFQHFVKAVGIYPVGSLVRLQSDRLAVIVAQGKESLLKPRVKVFYTAQEQHRLSPAFELDLADPNAADKIVGVEPPASWRFQDLEQLWLES